MAPRQPSRRIRFQWLAWLGLGFMRLLTKLPLACQLWIGRRLGDLAYFLLPGRRRVARINLALCFPELNPDRRKRLLHESFQSVGMGLMETFLCWWAPVERVRALCRLEGFEHLEAARQLGRGVILLSAHFTSLELGGRLLTLYEPLNAMYRPSANPLVDEIMRRGREQHIPGGGIAKDDVRGMLRALRRGDVVWYAPDQGVQRSYGEPVEFFGHAAITNTATSRFARVTGAPVVPFFTLRRKDRRGYRLIIQPPLDNFPSGDDIADATRINRLLEDIIREEPAQYFWLHRRFKRMPEGNPYEK